MKVRPTLMYSHRAFELRVYVLRALKEGGIEVVAEVGREHGDALVGLYPSQQVAGLDVRVAGGL